LRQAYDYWQDQPGSLLTFLLVSCKQLNKRASHYRSLRPGLSPSDIRLSFPSTWVNIWLAPWYKLSHGQRNRPSRGYSLVVYSQPVSRLPTQLSIPQGNRHYCVFWAVRLFTALLHHLLIGENTHLAIRTSLLYTASGVTHHLCIIYFGLFHPPLYCLELPNFHQAKTADWFSPAGASARPDVPPPASPGWSMVRRMKLSNAIGRPAGLTEKFCLSHSALQSRPVLRLALAEVWSGGWNWAMPSAGRPGWLKNFVLAILPSSPEQTSASPRLKYGRADETEQCHPPASRADRKILPEPICPSIQTSASPRLNCWRAGMAQIRPAEVTDRKILP